jgi:hypothetical protein
MNAERPLSERARKKHPVQRNYKPVIGDDAAFDPRPFFEAFDTKEQFWWGADYYRAFLPAGGSWLVWDKREGLEGVEYSNSEFELCWSMTAHHRKLLRVRWFGLCGTEKEDTAKRVHPTQKPAGVYTPIMEWHSKAGDIVTDPFLGSGTTMVAAQNLGRKCYGIEISPAYCAVILERMATAFPGIVIAKVE